MPQSFRVTGGARLSGTLHPAGNKNAALPIITIVALQAATILRGAVALTVAGRTDRGVPAWGQVASYEGEPADKCKAGLRDLRAPPIRP